MTTNGLIADIIELVVNLRADLLERRARQEEAQREADRKEAEQARDARSGRSV